MLDTWLQANSNYYMRYDLADVDFRWTFDNQNDTRLSLLAGMRYALLDQRLDVGYPLDTGAGDVQTVHSQINFEGGGLRIGFEGERRTPYGLVVYGRTVASAVAGTFRTNFTQTRPGRRPRGRYRLSCRPRGADHRRRDGRRIVVVERQVRLTAGYTFSGWFNVVRSDQFISAVQRTISPA